VVGKTVRKQMRGVDAFAGNRHHNHRYTLP
jgi:hypothetical protein